MTTLLKNFLLCDGSMDCGTFGSVVVRDGKIASLLPADARVESTEEVDARGRMALIPGFVNAHCHAAMSLLRGIGEEAPLMEWLREKIWPVEAKLHRDHIYWGTLLALLEMVPGGTTAFGDMYFTMDAVVEAALEAGVRCAPCRGITGVAEDALKDGLRLAETWRKERGFVSVQLGPHAPYTVPLPFMQEITAAARDRGLAVHVHFLETEWELGYLRDEFGMTPSEYLEASGILGAPGALLAHCVWLAPGDLEGVNLDSLSIANCPNSNLKLGNGTMDLPGLLGRTERIALGTDGAASNNRLDLWNEMRCAALLHKGITGDATVIRAKDALRMATYEGARALGFEKKGMIREGWEADLVLVDLDGPQYVGVTAENILPFLVYAGSSGDVRGTMVAGKWVYRLGECPGLPRGEILGKAEEIRKALLQ